MKFMNGKQYKNLEEGKEKLFNEMIQTINQNEKMIDHLQRTNTELENYAINLEKVCGLQ